MEALLDNLKQEVRRRIIEESMERVKYCLDQLSQEEIWFRPNAQSNSVGNLVLHLCGNARQWIVAGLSKQEDKRDRDAEFNEAGPLALEELFQLLDQTKAEIEQTLEQLQVDDLLQKFKVQGFQETGLGILIHVVEHFSYHTGQITYFVKYRKAIDTAYYSGIDLNKR